MFARTSTLQEAYGTVRLSEVGAIRPQLHQTSPLHYTLHTAAFCALPVLFFSIMFSFHFTKNGALIQVCCRGTIWTANMDELSCFDLTDGLDGMSAGK
jgi:hypothetical protein